MTSTKRPSPQGFQVTQTAGKVLARRNSKRLQSAFTEIAHTLLDAKVIDKNFLSHLTGYEPGTDAAKEDEDGDLETVAEDEKIEVETPSEVTSVEVGTVEPNEVEVAGSAFKDAVKRSTWHDRLESTLRLFQYQFVDLLEYPEVMFAQSSRSGAISALLEDVGDVLTDLAADHAGPYQPTVMALAAASENSQTIKISIGAVTLSAAKHANPNQHPVSGVLFRIDEPSENIPSVGPGLPLYISKEIAAEAVSQVSGLPLDAHDNLSQHANEDIAGVMLSASIEDKDFCVRGYLWGWSKNKKIQSITSAKEKLGMSMNAAAIGHEAVVDGTKVFWIDQLILLGANILYSNCATYEKTSLLAAEKSAEIAVAPDTNEQDEPLQNFVLSIAAQASTSSSTDEEEEGDPQPLTDLSEGKSPETVDQANPQDSTGESEMTTPEISKQLDTISASLTSLSSLATTVEEQGRVIAQVKDLVGEIQAERLNAAATIQAQAEAKTQESRDEAFLTKVQSIVAEGIAKAVNPSGQPPRKTVPLAASVAAPEGAITSKHLELATARGELKGLQENIHSDPSDMLRVQERIHQLNMELNVQ